jgi:SAM-dependent methyltransferase
MGGLPDQPLAAAAGGPAQWRAMAPGWARQRGFVAEQVGHVGNEMVDRLDPRPGETILELAAGIGDTGFAAAARLGPDGRLISSDVAPEMVAAAEARARELGLANVEHRVLDLESLDLPDASVDGALCRWGFMFPADPGVAFSETRRVLRPGGRLVFAVWAEAASNPWGTVIGRALVDMGLVERPDPDAPGPFRLADPERVRALVLGAGFAELELVDVPVTWRHESLDAYWGVTADLSFAAATALGTLDEAALAELRDRVAASLAPWTAADGSITAGGLCRVGTARTG